MLCSRLTEFGRMRQRRSRDCEWMRQRRSVSASGFNDCVNGKFLHAVECFSVRVRLRQNEEAWYRKVVNCITYGMEAGQLFRMSGMGWV